MEQSSGGVGILGLLGIIFIVLKLCHVIAWSWFWVLSPFYFALFIIVMCLGIVLVALGMAAFSMGKKK